MVAIANATGHQRPVRAGVYETVVIPLDGSQLARRMLPHALTLARAFDCRIHLVRATGATPIGQRWDQPALSGTADEDADMTPAEAIAREAEGLRGSGLEVTATVKDGAAADLIVEAAEAQSAPLIAMATHGRSGLGRWLLGSVAEKVLQMSASPLLLVRSDSEINLTHSPFIARVVLALDGSQLAELAVSHAAAIAKKLRVPVTVLQVVRSTDAVAGGHISIEDEAIRDEAGEAEAPAVRRYLEETAERLRADGVVEVSTQVITRFDAADGILLGGGSSPNTLVVMTSRGLSGIKRWALGSVTSRVVSHGEGPVLVIRAGEGAG